MTEEQKVTAKRFRSEAEKDLLISKMLECPAELSDAEIKQILADDELRDIYSISVDIKAAKNNQAEIDATAEWNRFRPKLARPRRWNISLLARVAAILVGALLVSAGIFFITNRETATQAPLFAQNDEPKSQDTETTEPSNTDTITVNGNETEAQEYNPMRHRRAIKPMLASTSKSLANESRERTRSDYAECSRLKTTVKLQKAEAQTSVDVDEYIRIQQARMDNDLAMQNAEAMVNQFYAIADINEAICSNLGDGSLMEDEIVTLIIP